MAFLNEVDAGSREKGPFNSIMAQTPPERGHEIIAPLYGRGLGTSAA